MRFKYLLISVMHKVSSWFEPRSITPVTSISKADISLESTELCSFFLDEDSKFEILGTPSDIKFKRWTQIDHCVDKRTAIILVAGEKISLSESITIKKNFRFYIRFSAGLPNISLDGLHCEIYFIEFKQTILSEKLIAIFPLTGGVQTLDWREAELDISFLTGLSGYFSVRCHPAKKGDPYRDWLAISDLCIAREDQLHLIRARSFHNMRSRNEIEHFSSVYRHSMYTDEQRPKAELAAIASRRVRKLVCKNDDVDLLSETAICEVNPLPGESPYVYATRLLFMSIPQLPPNFQERLRLRAAGGGVVKILSLCSGSARVEAGLAEQVGVNVEWSLLDINVDLLGLASEQFSASVKLDLIEANVNDLTCSGEKWDIIICVSALHHVVELEKLIKVCHDSLNDDGEFWSIGECVGRNGNRLWPEAEEEASNFFHQLPERYRHNHHTNQLDIEIPDNDYSVATFEGIRSEDIESVIDRWFHPVDVYRRNCFLWRLINLAYSDNYNLQNPEDRMWIERMVYAEANCYRAGGRGNELHGVYRPRLLGISRDSRSKVTN